MSKTRVHHQINYVEFTTQSIERSREFYEAVFGWHFKFWGPDYMDCTPEDAGLAIGFARNEAMSEPLKFAPLVVLYSQDLAATEAAIVAAGGQIVVRTFEFPGGRRFHFRDPGGNVLAVWSE